MAKYQIFVTAKKGIFDPAGTISKNALGNLGYEGINDVKIGKFIQMDVDDSVTEKDIEEMCEKLLANPVIEDFTIGAED